MAARSVPSRAAASADVPTSSTLCLFGGPYQCRAGRRLPVPEGGKRLLVYVALHEGPADRRHAAGALWPAGDDERAFGNLRSALWRLRGCGIDCLTTDRSALFLRPGTRVDVDEVDAWAGRVLDGVATPHDLSMPPRHPEVFDLLPGWTEDWVVFERERVRQRVLHATEALSRELVRMSRCAEAIEAALAAVRVEPLRESAQRALAEAHLAEGNVGEARRVFAGYADLVRSELGVEPSRTFTELLDRPRAVQEGTGPGTPVSFAAVPGVSRGIEHTFGIW